MKLYQKTLLTIGITLSGLIGVLYATTSSILVNGFTQLEKREVRQNVQRVQNAYSNYLNEFNALNYQWAAWDETYGFIQNGNPDYIKRNLRPADFQTLNINLILYLNASGKLVYGRGFNLKQRQFKPVPTGFLPSLRSKMNLRQQPNNMSRFSGIVLLPEGALVLSALPILTGQGKGPVRGTLIMGRYLNSDEIKRLSQLTRLNITAYKVTDPKLPSDVSAVKAALSSQVQSSETSIVVQPSSTDTIRGYTLLQDIYNQPALLLRVDLPRDIYKQGRVSLNYFIVSLLVVGFVFTVATLLLLRRLVLSRLARLSNEVKSIGTTGDFSMRVAVSGADELSSLGSTINWMLEALESFLKELSAEREKADQLLLNVLPHPIADRLKNKQSTIADSFAEATVLFADIVGFTAMASHTSPVELVSLLNQIFSAFDRLAELHGLEKIKTIGDAYMVVGGIPVHREDHVESVAQMALDMQEAISLFNQEKNSEFTMRIGISTGPVVAGVIGIKKFIYDLWGDTVNIASRMESHGLPGCIQVTAATYERLKDKFKLEKRGVIQVKGKGEMTTYLLLGRK
jgi:sensor domain CHASE-containing protein/class 3 adenylate cyclase